MEVAFCAGVTMLPIIYICMKRGNRILIKDSPFFRLNSSNRRPFDLLKTFAAFQLMMEFFHLERHAKHEKERKNELVDKPLTRLRTIYSMQFILPLANIN